MFTSQAHSFVQQARLAITLSWVAGYTNALTLLECNQVTSHVTGTVSQVGVEAVQGNTPRLAYLTTLVATFLLGAFVSGVLTEFGRMRRFRSIYVLPMSVEAIALALFAVLVELSNTGRLPLPHAVAWMTFLPSFAMGVQNATITRISGGVVRTTHVSGVVTDLGLEFSRLLFLRVRGRRRVDLRHIRQEQQRALLLASILGSFVFGGAMGAVCFDFLEPFSMVPAVLFLAFVVLQDILRPIAPVELRNGNYRGAPIIALYHAEPPPDRRQSRMPDLSTWSSHLDDHVRVIVLDLTSLPPLDAQGALEVTSLMRQLRSEGRSLVLGGCGPKHLTGLRHAGALDEFDDDDVCADLAAATERAEDIAEEL